MYIVAVEFSKTEKLSPYLFKSNAKLQRSFYFVCFGRAMILYSNHLEQCLTPNKCLTHVSYYYYYYSISWER